VNDEVVDSREVTLSRENATQTFTYTPEIRSLQDQPGRPGGRSTRIQSNCSLSADPVLLIAISAGIYLYKTGELEKLRRQLQGR
jgi:hypothetical protein